MADDRIYLVCKVCSKQVMLYKLYPGQGYAADRATLTDWMSEHLHERAYSQSLHGDPGFTLATESDSPPTLATEIAAHHSP